jgi:hypothetical protein
MLNQKTLLTGAARGEPGKEIRHGDRVEAEVRYLQAARERLKETGREPEPAFLQDVWERIRSKR